MVPVLFYKTFPPVLLSLRVQGFQHPNTRTHLRLLGPCYKTGGLQPFFQVHFRAEFPKKSTANAPWSGPGRKLGLLNNTQSLLPELNPT